MEHVFARTRHWSAPYRTLLQPAFWNTVSLKSTFQLALHLLLGLPRYFPWTSPTKLLCSVLISSKFATFPVCLTPLEFITLIFFFGKGKKQNYPSVRSVSKWRVEVWLHSFLIWGLEGGWSASRPNCFSPGKRPPSLVGLHKRCEHFREDKYLAPTGILITIP
jgi:hypothetical protein